MYRDVVSKRLSLILAPDDERALAPFIDAGTEQHAALRRWADNHGLPAGGSEASTPPPGNTQPCPPWSRLAPRTH